MHPCFSTLIFLGRYFSNHAVVIWFFRQREISERGEKQVPALTYVGACLVEGKIEGDYIQAKYIQAKIVPSRLVGNPENSVLIRRTICKYISLVSGSFRSSVNL